MARRKRKGSALNAPEVDESWRARSDLETIQRAAEITEDKRRLAAAKAEAARQKESLDRISRLEGKKL